MIQVALIESRRVLEIVFTHSPYGTYVSAWDARTYDVSYEGEDESGPHWRVSPSGWGRDEQSAARDLMERLEK